MFILLKDRKRVRRPEDSGVSTPENWSYARNNEVSGRSVVADMPKTNTNQPKQNKYKTSKKFTMPAKKLKTFDHKSHDARSKAQNNIQTKQISKE